MSRHRGVKKIIDEALDAEQEEEEDYYGDDYELTEDDYAFADEIWDALKRKCTQEDVIAVLNQVDWDGDKAYDILEKRIEKQKEQPKKPVETKQAQESQKPKVTEPKAIEPTTISAGDRKYSEEEKLNFKQEAATTTNNAYIDKSKFNFIYPPIKYKTEAKNLDILNVAVAGHVDSGKSTLVGQLLCLSGTADKTTMHRAEKDSQTAGKSASKLAWMLDEREEERARGITIDVGMKRIVTPKRTIVLFDCPGHKDFVDNMMIGAAQADLGILVIDVIKNSFEAGFSQGGQTKEHGLILKSMGIPKVLVAFNKMDYVNWNEERYSYANSLITAYLQEIGYEEEDIYQVPISGLQGQNVYTKYKDPVAEWYEGATLLEILENIVVVRQAVNKPLRMNISSVYYASTGKVKGHCLTGKIAAGVLEKGGKYVIMPYGVEVSIKDILTNEEKTDVAHVGETPTLSLKIKEQDFGRLSNGHLLCDPKYPAPVAKRFRAIIEIYDYEYPLIKGERVNLHVNLVKTSAVISKIMAIVDKKTLEPTKKNPRCLSSGQTAKVELTCDKAICMELFENYPTYGRFTLREKGESIAAGRIMEIIE